VRGADCKCAQGAVLFHSARPLVILQAIRTPGEGPRCAAPVPLPDACRGEHPLADLGRELRFGTPPVISYAIIARGCPDLQVRPLRWVVGDERMGSASCRAYAGNILAVNKTQHMWFAYVFPARLRREGSEPWPPWLHLAPSRFHRQRCARACCRAPPLAGCQHVPSGQPFARLVGACFLMSERVWFF
jgi:hypothetical protein